MSRKEDVESLIKTHKRRLQKLKESAAVQGLETPIHIKLEIEDIEAEITRLRQEREAEQADGGEEGEARQVFEDFEFTDRKIERDAILGSHANHIELYGPPGVGKTYFLRHITKDRANVRAVYIDLRTHHGIEEIQREVVRHLQTKPEQQQGMTEKDFAMAIHSLYRPKSGRPVNHFLFLFDSATKEHQQIIDWLFSAEGLINSQKFLRFLQTTLGINRHEIKLQVIVATHRPLATISFLDKDFHPDKFRIDMLRKHVDPAVDPIQCMLRELADHADIPIAPLACQKVSDKIYYLTAGHPGCVKLLLFAVAGNNFLVPTAEEWQGLFEWKVLYTIQREMLGTVVDFDLLLPVFQVLSIFRYFDQRLLGALMKRSVLFTESEIDNISRQARELRKSLSNTYLIREPEAVGEAIFSLDPAVRRVLSLGLQYRSPKRFQLLNQIALDIYTNWLKNANTTPGRAIIFLVEILYHQIKGLEIGGHSATDTQYQQVQQTVDENLGLLLRIIDEDLRPSYLSKLKGYLKGDHELQEIIQQAMGHTCYSRLVSQIEKFVIQNS